MTRKTLNGWQRLSVAAMTVWTVFMVGFFLLVVRPEAAKYSSAPEWVLVFGVVLWLTPPLLVFLFQWVTWWIYRGFRGD
jgi:hypothetical protein